MSSSIREAIAAELTEARAAADAALARVQQLEDLDAQAAQLDGEEPTTATTPPSAAEPAAPRRKTPASAGRRSQPQRADKAHTAKGASTGGRPDKYPLPEDLDQKVLAAIRRVGRLSIGGIIADLDGPPATSGRPMARWSDAIKATVSQLLNDGKVKFAGNGRGGAPTYAPTAVFGDSAPKHPVDQLVDKITEALELDGGRVARSDLKTRVGDPEFEDFNVALDRALNLKKISRTIAGGVTGFEVAR